VNPPASVGEAHFREQVANALMSRADLNGGFLRLDELEALPLDDRTTIRVIDGGGGGIWNPNALEATLSIVTSPDGPYADRELAGGLLKYHYQSGPTGGKNTKLRRAMELGLPVIRFQKIATKTYVPIYPVFVIADDPDAREFTLAVDQMISAVPTAEHASEIERRYVERIVRQRVHQRTFRAQVMLAYASSCAVCVLKKAPLLDAAHIIGDGERLGDAVVANGLSLCKIHHAAYDQNILGITPECRVVLNAALLEESDGPMLLHGLQEMHMRALHLPQSRRDRPDPGRLSTRYEQFLAS